MSKKCPESSKFIVLKYLKVLEFLKNPKAFLNKGTKHKKKYIKRLNSKNNNIKGGGSP